MPMKETQMNGHLTGCVQVEGRNAFCALLLLTLWPLDKPLHRPTLSLNKVHTAFSADALTAVFLLYPVLLFLYSACWQLKGKLPSEQKGLLLIYGRWELCCISATSFTPHFKRCGGSGCFCDTLVPQVNNLFGYLATGQRALTEVKGEESCI